MEEQQPVGPLQRGGGPTGGGGGLLVLLHVQDGGQQGGLQLLQLLLQHQQEEGAHRAWRTRRTQNSEVELVKQFPGPWRVLLDATLRTFGRDSCFQRRDDFRAKGHEIYDWPLAQEKPPDWLLAPAEVRVHSSSQAFIQNILFFGLQGL